MRPSIYYTIHDWMIQIGLSGNDLVIFAYLYAMYRHNREEENTTAKIAEHTGTPERTVRDILMRLQYISLVDIDYDMRPQKTITCEVNIAKVNETISAFVDGYLNPTTT